MTCKNSSIKILDVILTELRKELGDKFEHSPLMMDTITDYDLKLFTDLFFRGFFGKRTALSAIQFLSKDENVEIKTTLNLIVERLKNKSIIPVSTVSRKGVLLILHHI
ncbi:hypothetical protein [Proteus mirabilis]|uniref:hypothetical protein n=1 Tax=Proteus mirabilis TaxID=584 RepID=UPI0034D61CF6